MADPNPLAGMPLAESLANNMNESLQWMARMWGNPAAASAAGAQPLAFDPSQWWNALHEQFARVASAAAQQPAAADPPAEGKADAVRPKWPAEAPQAPPEGKSARKPS